MKKTIQGNVKSQSSNVAVSTGTVEVFARDKPDASLASATTDEKGSFDVTVRVAAGLIWWQDLGFKVRVGSVEFPVAAVKWSVRIGIRFVTITVGEPVAPRRLDGTVLHTDGTAVSGQTVRALNRRLGGEDILGEAESDAGGRFEIEYTAPEAP